MARRLLCVSVFLLLSCSFSLAQSLEHSNHFEVFGGFSFMTPDFSKSAPHGASGWNVSGAFNFARYAGVVVDFSGFSPSGPDPCRCGGPFAHYRTYMAGPQASIHVRKMRPFAHVLIGRTLGGQTLVGGSQANASFSYLTYAAGGGVDFTLKRPVALRGQVDGCTSALFWGATWPGSPRD